MNSLLGWPLGFNLDNWVNGDIFCQENNSFGGMGKIMDLSLNHPWVVEQRCIRSREVSGGQERHLGGGKGLGWSNLQVVTELFYFFS